MRGALAGMAVSAASRGRKLWLLTVGAVVALGALAAWVAPGSASVSQPSSTVNKYHQANLVSDIAGVARITDPKLVNPWGMSASPSSPLWISDNGTNVSTLYQGGVAGSIPQIVPLTVKIP